MSTEVKHRRGTAAQHATFTGAEAEVTYDSTNKTLRAHDGVTAGGFPLAVVITPAMFGATGSGNDHTAIVAWLDYLAASGDVGVIDKDYSFATTIVHSGNVNIRGSFSDNARLIFTGTGDGLELTGGVDIDGVIVDGNLAADAVPTETSEAGCLLGIHGPLTGSPGYLSGVKIGRLRVQNTRRRAALALVNLSDFNVERIEASGTFGNAFHLVGLKNGRIDSYAFDRVGNLGADASRLGAGIAMYAEGDAGKTPATWYVVAGVQPTDNVDISSGRGSRTTDTSIYLHDTYGSGVGNVRFGHYQGTLIGKDGVKFRDGAKNCRMSSCQLRKVGLRFAVIEDAGSDNNSILNVDADEAGFDVIGEWLDGSPGTRNFTVAANGLNQTLNQTPGGFRMNGVANCQMTGAAKHVRDATHNGAEGNGLNARSLSDCIIDVALEDCDGLARLGALTRCSAKIDATNMGRNGTTVTGAVYIDDAGSETTDTILKVVSREKSGSAVIQYPCRINGTGTGYDVEALYSGPHTLSAGIVTRADSTVFAKYRNNGTIAGRGSVTFDGSGNGTITHDAGTTPAFLASHEGGLSYGVRVTALTSTTATVALFDLATAAAVVSVTRTVSWVAHRLRQPQGFTY